MISRKQQRLRHDHGGAAGLHFPAHCLLQTGKRTCGPPGLQIIIRSMHTKMDAETASMASTAVCASEQAEAAQKVCAERAVWSCIVVRAIVHASFLLRCSDFSAAGGIFQVINFIKLSPGPAKELGDSAGNRPGSRRGCRAGRWCSSADGFEGGLEVGEDVVDPVFRPGFTCLAVLWNLRSSLRFHLRGSHTL